MIACANNVRAARSACMRFIYSPYLRISQGCIMVLARLLLSIRGPVVDDR